MSQTPVTRSAARARIEAYERELVLADDALDRLVDALVAQAVARRIRPSDALGADLRTIDVRIRTRVVLRHRHHGPEARAAAVYRTLNRGAFDAREMFRLAPVVLARLDEIVESTTLVTDESGALVMRRRTPASAPGTTKKGAA